MTLRFGILACLLYSTHWRVTAVPRRSPCGVAPPRFFPLRLFAPFLCRYRFVFHSCPFVAFSLRMSIFNFSFVETPPATLRDIVTSIFLQKLLFWYKIMGTGVVPKHFDSINLIRSSLPLGDFIGVSNWTERFPSPSGIFSRSMAPQEAPTNQQPTKKINHQVGFLILVPSTSPDFHDMSWFSKEREIGLSSCLPSSLPGSFGLRVLTSPPPFIWPNLRGSRPLSGHIWRRVIHGVPHKMKRRHKKNI